jgi:hypothetical protein
MIKKTIPSDKIIKLLSEEIKTFGVDFAKNIKPFNVTKSSFDMWKYSIPSSTEIYKACDTFGTFDMKRKDEPIIKNVCDELNAVHCTNTVYYTANSCIDWHTNSDNEGKRVYILFTSKPGIFRYKHPETGEIIDDYDNVGWTQREFKVDKTNLLWHCVYSPAPRFAYGFNIKL